MLNQRWHLILVALFTFVGFQNCTPQVQEIINDSGPSVANSNKYFQTTNKVVIHVYYEPGAEPFTGQTAQGHPYWNILEENLQAIFQFRSTVPVLVVPKTIGAMTSIPAQNRAGWTGIDLLQLDNQFGIKGSPDSESHFHIYFLKGYYSNGSIQSNVIGISLTGTTVIGMFKEVIENMGQNPNGPIPKFVEQSTLVHEMGHALGFVNSGVPMASPHQDTAHGAHTVNSDCVMYWQNEGGSDLIQFVQKYLTSASRVMWGPEVLADAQQISR